MNKRFKILEEGVSTTDSSALSSRIASYAKFASKDVNQILVKALSHLDRNESLDILDLGCGTGKQSLYLADHFPCARIRSVDLSNESLAQVNALNRSQIQTIHGSYDDPNLQVQLGDRQYDVILSFFSLYYASDFEAWMEWIKKSLKPGGRMILVGYSSQNNREIVELSKQWGGAENQLGDFVQFSELDRVFGLQNLQLEHFSNQMCFGQYSDFAEYYRSYGLYDRKVDQCIERDFDSGKLSSFTWTKDSLVVLYDHFPQHLSLPLPLRCDSFQKEQYAEFLARAKAAGYHFIRFRELRHGKIPGKVLLLRHDVDLDLDAALQMAEIEASLGICSTYFAMASGAYYNPFSDKNRSILKRIEALGHEIGLHYDREIAESAQLLSTVLANPVQSVSQHNPTLNGMGAVEHGLIDAYDPSWIQDWELEYVSDSGKKWRNHNLQTALEIDRLYLLVHPESWIWQSLDIVEMIRSAEMKQVREVQAKFAEFAQENVLYHQQRFANESL